MANLNLGTEYITDSLDAKFSLGEVPTVSETLILPKNCLCFCK